ncbi:MULTISPECIES: gamma-type small acid-soluble spore protein [Brevibacillus]|uniref:Small, acid-soluble spore protein gamma-type n=2 Tax=Brevibacillus TaxID=55080 RepID=A0A517IC18_BREBE|nr:MULTISPECIES: gamma-type small acid-soluble spore protein [Brevibacillus]MDC0765138.1 gamma-type small acid-soluble spore protein [Brevibacillus sp. AG]MED1802208.1 gamma-type small acid-soluble spore protein [Brevibacillus porteri]MED2131217.1 gamma-type small acid-soluble spore protein [Brevibacillus porteri]MED2744791.1 gamma-type small acid-soluble spore protein [Brevibacillus porteri]MED2815703.1 gamma-type small acid-soluble spore protein [Brevibacillus porteri]
MPKQNKQAGMGKANQASQAANTATEFASETNAAEVRSQNQQSAQRAASQGAATEFASETNVAEVRRQNQQSAAQQSSGQATE